ncbi:hypothetical protein [Actinokineospora sp. PR83]|nr:hypothetical protein [Actinokineospora sp. PR83]
MDVVAAADNAFARMRQRASGRVPRLHTAHLAVVARRWQGTAPPA